MIDAATSDEDKVTPVYKLEEICELLRSSHVSIVKEVSEFILKRLDHKSPIVKQKALRLIKYAVVKSGVEFRREMQRHSVAVRQLFHYKGQVDPLKGDALNKVVRDTAHEAISAIFSADDSKPSPAEDLNKRIQGFGNTNFEMPSEDKKSFLSEVVGIGSASIKQGLSTITQAHSSLRKNDNGSYKSPNLRRSLTIENDYPEAYERGDHHNGLEGNSGISKTANTGPWNHDLRTIKAETTNEDSSSSYTEGKTREERLLDTIVTSGGVRLQPTRDALQVFLTEASKVDALALCRALDVKLQSQLWQIRMKAVCVLEAILRKKDDDQFPIAASYFTEKKDVVVRCSESPQASLREKANKVLILLVGEQTGSVPNPPEKPVSTERTTVHHMPDLIDTRDPDDHGAEDSMKKQSDQNAATSMTSTVPPLIDDLFGDNSLGPGIGSSEQKNGDDPFADVSFHTSEAKEHVDDLFSGMTIDDKPGVSGISSAPIGNGPGLFDIFGSNTETAPEKANHKDDVNDIMAGLSINENAGGANQKKSSLGALSETIFSDSNGQMNGGKSTMFPVSPMAYNMPAGIMYNPAFPSQAINYTAMNSFFTQQQLLATMSSFQHLSSQNSGVNHGAGTKDGGGYGSPLPDIFNPGIPTQTTTTMMNNTKKEETKAFDFISDHLAAARDPKRVL